MFIHLQLILFISVFFTGELLSQNKPVVEKLSGSEISAISCPMFVGETDKGYFLCYAANTQKKTLVALSKDNGSILAKKELAFFKANGEKRTLSRFFVLNNDLYALLWKESWKQKKIFYYAHKVNQQTLEIDPNGKLILERSSEYLIPFYYEEVTRWLPSPDKKSLILASCEYTTPTTCQLKVTCLDSTLTLGLISSYSFSSSYPSLPCMQYLVDNNSNLYFLIRELSQQDSAQNLIKMMRFQPNNGKAPESRVIGKNIVDAHMTLDKKGELVVGGYYSENGKNSARGVFTGRLDPNSLQLHDVRVRPFTVDDILRNLSEAERKEYQKNNIGKQPELHGYFVQDVVADDAGDIFIIGEEYKERRMVTYSTNTNTISVGPNTWIGISNKTESGESVRYVFGNVIVSCIPASGEALYNHYVLKKQECDGYYKQVASVRTRPGDGITLMYNAFSHGDFYLVGSMIGYERDRRSLYHKAIHMNANGTIEETTLLCDLIPKDKSEPLEKYSCKEKIVMDQWLPLHNGSWLMLLINDKGNYQLFRWK